MNIKQSNQEVQAIRHRFPNKVPVNKTFFTILFIHQFFVLIMFFLVQLYVERYSREREVPALGRNKFLVPQELTMSQFLYIIRTKMKLRDSQVRKKSVSNRAELVSCISVAYHYSLHHTQTE